VQECISTTFKYKCTTPIYLLIIAETKEIVVTCKI